MHSQGGRTSCLDTVFTAFGVVLKLSKLESSLLLWGSRCHRVATGHCTCLLVLMGRDMAAIKLQVFTRQAAMALQWGIHLAGKNRMTNRHERAVTTSASAVTSTPSTTVSSGSRSISRTRGAAPSTNLEAAAEGLEETLRPNHASSSRADAPVLRAAGRGKLYEALVEQDLRDSSMHEFLTDMTAPSSRGVAEAKLKTSSKALCEVAPHISRRPRLLLVTPGFALSARR